LTDDKPILTAQTIRHHRIADFPTESFRRARKSTLPPLPPLLHAAQPHHGTRPRFMAQPPLYPAVPYELERADGNHSPVECAIRRGLAREG
jgi:hypothetical protein